MKITLINPPIKIEEIYGKYSSLASFQPPIGLCALAGYLINNGYREVEILDANVLGLSISKIVNIIRNSTPDLVGIYTNTSNYYVVTRLVSEIKKNNRWQKIVVGGPHPTFLAKDTLVETEVDYCVIGEGELTLLELVQHIDGNGNNLVSIDGLAFKTVDNQIIINKPRNGIMDLDSLPFPAIHLLPPLLKYKLYLLQYKRLPYMTLMTSRGCPYKCVFCETPFGKIARYHSAEYVVDYVTYLKKQFGVRELHFCDDTFSINEERVFKICELIQKRNLNISWYAATRANVKNKMIFKEMKKAGCWIVAIGAESGDQEVLRMIQKKVSLEQIRETCKAVLKAGLKLKAFFILGNPGETSETLERTIKFAVSLKAHYPVFSLMTPFPGTELWHTYEKYGKFERSEFQKLIISSSDPVFIPTALTKDILLSKQKKAFRKTYFNLGMIKRQIGSIRSLEDLKKLFQAFFTFIKVQLK